jgi:hypothetical protein
MPSAVATTLLWLTAASIMGAAAEVDAFWCGAFRRDTRPRCRRLTAPRAPARRVSLGASDLVSGVITIHQIGPAGVPTAVAAAIASDVRVS